MQGSPEIPPWYALPPVVSGDVAVIGAGIAGAATAYALARRGFVVSLYERGAGPAEGASGNPRGVVMPAPSSERDGYGRFYLHAYRHTLALLEQLVPRFPRIGWRQQGVLWLGRKGAEERRLLRPLEGSLGRAGGVRLLKSDEASEIAGIAIDRDGLWYPQAGSLSPVGFCSALLEAAGVEPHYQSTVASVREYEGGWRLSDEQGRELGEHAAVVITAGAESTRIEPCAELPLQVARGQVSLLPSSDYSDRLSCVICHEGYLLPAEGGAHLLGASYARNSQSCDLREADHHHSLQLLQQQLAGFDAWQLASVLGGRAALRATTGDRLPLLGPLPDGQRFCETFADLRHGRSVAAYPRAPYRSGLFVNLGHGSRGLIGAPYAAELLAQMMTGSTLTASLEFYSQLHAARFLVRALRRGS